MPSVAVEMEGKISRYVFFGKITRSFGTKILIVIESQSGGCESFLQTPTTTGEWMSFDGGHTVYQRASSQVAVRQVSLPNRMRRRGCHVSTFPAIRRSAKPAVCKIENVPGDTRTPLSMEDRSVLFVGYSLRAHLTAMSLGY